MGYVKILGLSERGGGGGGGGGGKVGHFILQALSLKSYPPYTHLMKKMNGPIKTKKLISWTFQMATRSPVRYYFIGKHQTVLWMKALVNCLCDWSMTNKDAIKGSSQLRENTTETSSCK